MSRVRTPLLLPSSYVVNAYVPFDDVKRIATSLPRATASMRASASLDDTYRTAPAARASSRPVRSLGIVLAVTVPATPSTMASSPNVAIDLFRRRRPFGPGRHRDLRL